MLAGLAESVLAWRRLLSPLESVWDRSACLLMLLKLQAPVCASTPVDKSTSWADWIAAVPNGMTNLSRLPQIVPGRAGPVPHLDVDAVATGDPGKVANW
jgi:hypothetical protein